MDEFEGASLKTPKQIEDQHKKPMTGARFGWRVFWSIAIPLGIIVAGFVFVFSDRNTSIGWGYVLYFGVPVLLMFVIYISLFVAIWKRLRYAKITLLWMVIVLAWMIMASSLPYDILILLQKQTGFQFGYWPGMFTPMQAMLLIFITFLIFVPRDETFFSKGWSERVAWGGAWGTAIVTFLFFQLPLGFAGGIILNLMGSATHVEFNRARREFIQQFNLQLLLSPLVLTAVFTGSLIAIVIIRHRQNTGMRIG